MQIVNLPLSALTPYEKNTRKHTEKDIEKIVESIERYGFSDPIGIWGENNIIVEGHGRMLAADLLGMDEVPCIRLDHMSDEQRREYAIAHNRTAEFSEWDFDNLKKELAELDFDGFDLEWDFEKKEEANPYTAEVKIPQYDVQGDIVMLDELMDGEKCRELIAEIESSGVSRNEKEFLIHAAGRHNVFNYKKIAEYYASASEEMQKLMEKSALVIIDYNDAIANGYVELSKKIKELRENA